MMVVAEAMMAARPDSDHLDRARFLPSPDTTELAAEREPWLLRCFMPLLGWRQDLEIKRKSLVRKNGIYRTFGIGLAAHSHRFLADIYITLLDLSWPYLVVLLSTIYLLFVLVFAVLWWAMAFHNGDFDNLNNPTHEFCLSGVKTFLGAIMFSVETQTTVGYGFSYPNAHCPATMPLMYLQVIAGLLLETLMLGSVFVKIARPKHRANTILFSRHALINQERGKLVLQVRVGDLRKSHLVDSYITGMVIHRHSTHEGVVYPLYQSSCSFTADGMGDRMFLLFPVIVRHVIDKDSPLYEVSPGDVKNEKFEIVLYLTGTVESTGEVCQARTSYLPGELLWGHRFQRIEEFDASHCHWRLDFTGFDKVVACQNISFSAADLDRLHEEKTDDCGRTSPGGRETTGPFLCGELDTSVAHSLPSPSSDLAEQSESKV